MNTAKMLCAIVLSLGCASCVSRPTPAEARAVREQDLRGQMAMAKLQEQEAATRVVDLYEKRLNTASDQLTAVKQSGTITETAWQTGTLTRQHASRSLGQARAAVARGDTSEQIRLYGELDRSISELEAAAK